MAWLIGMAGLRDLRRDDGVSDVSSTVLGDGMSELVRRLRDMCIAGSDCRCSLNEAVDRIKQLERELSAEKALSDRLIRRLLIFKDTKFWVQSDEDNLNTYRKSRGLE